jgi:hypothetical protein
MSLKTFVFKILSTDSARLNLVRQPSSGPKGSDGCLSKGVYIEMMIDNLKVTFRCCAILPKNKLPKPEMSNDKSAPFEKTTKCRMPFFFDILDFG